MTQPTFLAYGLSLHTYGATGLGDSQNVATKTIDSLCTFLRVKKYIIIVILVRLVRFVAQKPEETKFMYNVYFEAI